MNFPPNVKCAAQTQRCRVEIMEQHKNNGVEEEGKIYGTIIVKATTMSSSILLSKIMTNLPSPINPPEGPPDNRSRVVHGCVYTKQEKSGEHETGPTRTISRLWENNGYLSRFIRCISNVYHLLHLLVYVCMYLLFIYLSLIIFHQRSSSSSLPSLAIRLPGSLSKPVSASLSSSLLDPLVSLVLG